MRDTILPLAMLGAVSAVAVVWSAASPSAVQNTAPPWRLVESFPQLPPGEAFATVSGVAVDAKGIVYVFERDELGDVFMFEKSGRFLGKWSPSGKPGFVKMAHTIHIDPDGFIWITDRTGHQIKKFTADGRLMMTLGTGQPGSGTDTFNGPTGIQFLQNGDLLVSDGYWNSRVVWFNKDGTFLRSIGTARPRNSMEGRGPGHFGLVHAAAQGSNDRVFVSDRCDGPVGPDDETRRNPQCQDSRVQVVDRNGNFIEYWNQYKGPLCLLPVGNRLYMADGNRIAILDVGSGKEIEAITGAAGAHQIAVDAAEQNVYVTALGNAGGRTGGRGNVKRFTREPKPS